MTRASGAGSGAITFIQRITRQLTRDGLLVEDADQTYLDLQIDDTLGPMPATGYLPCATL